MRQFAKLVVLRLLKAYKWAISPMFPPACRYVPSCSDYAIEAVERYGAARGGLMALWRLLRCHPFAHGGIRSRRETQSSPFDFAQAKLHAEHARSRATEDTLRNR